MINKNGRSLRSEGEYLKGFGFTLFSVLALCTSVFTLSACDTLEPNVIKIKGPELPNPPFDQTWTFNSDSSYTMSSNTIDFSNGYAELTPASQTDGSNIGAGFAGGSSTGTTFSTATDGNSNSNYVMLNQSGAPTNNSELDASWAPEWFHVVGYWKLNESSSSSTVADSSGQNYTGTPTSGTTLGSVGKLNNSAQFSGGALGGGISFPMSNMNYSGSNLSFSAWINPTSVAGYHPIISRDHQYLLGILNGQLHFADSANWSFNAVAGTLQTNTWQHVMLVRNTTGYTFYINGSAVGTYSVSNPINANANIIPYIGDWPLGNGNLFGGNIDEVLVWNTALTASEVQAMYSRQSAQYAGTFTSRVMDGLATTASWTNFSWVPTLPFFKELPDSGSSETQANYSSQSSSLMSGIGGLWHLDETTTGTGGSAGKDFRDASGNGNWGTAEGGTTLGASGAFQNAVNFDGSTGYVKIPYTSNIAQTNQLTASAWVNLNTASSSGTVFSTGVNCSGGGYTLNLSSSGVQLSVVIGSIQNNLFSYYNTPANKWNLITFTYNTGVVNVYVNGVSVISDSSYSGSIPYNTNSGLRIGADFCLSNTLSAKIEEVGIWSRVLSQSEVIELYRRGANRIKYQVRTCTASDCSDDATNANWKGPDNTNQTYFSELNNNAVQSDGGDLTSSDSVQAGLPTMNFANFSGLTVPTHRYFQYRAIMESDDSSTNCNYGSGATWCSPELQAVSVGPGHYDASAPTITNNTGVSYESLSSLVEALGSGGCSEGTLYNISPDGTVWFYWTGSAWGIADGTVGNASPASVVTTNLASFSTQVGIGNFYFKVFLPSSGTSACSLSSLELTGQY